MCWQRWGGGEPPRGVGANWGGGRRRFSRRWSLYLNSSMRLRARLYGFHTGTRSLSNRKGRGRRRGGREREPRIPKPPGCSQGVLAGGSEGSFLCSLSSRFSGGGGGVGSPPRAWRRVGVPPAASVLKKFVRLASTFPSPPFGSSDFAAPRRPRLHGFHTGTRSLSNRKGRGRRRGGREREPRIFF